MQVTLSFVFAFSEPEEFDPSGVAAYVQECNRVGVIPASFFKRNVHGSNFAMRNHGLGPLGAKAICKPLSVSCYAYKTTMNSAMRSPWFRFLYNLFLLFIYSNMPM